MEQTGKVVKKQIKIPYRHGATRNYEKRFVLGVATILTGVVTGQLMGFITSF